MVFRPVRRRTLVRGAMVGGAAYYAGSKAAQGKAQNAQEEQRLEALETQQAAAPPQQGAAPTPPPAAEEPSMVEKLTELKKLLDAGILTQEEFDTQKAKVLEG